MQFIPYGPDIPNELLHAHEEGRVLFFCGAGISYPAGLPGFGELVIRMSKHAGEPLDRSEQDMVTQGGLDRAIGHYEKRIQGGRAAVRRGLPSCLTADLSKPRALTTHLALLTLGKDKKDNLKLVTTNFDTLFEKAGKSPITIHQAPPSRSRWNGVVHLHGRMPDSASEEDLDQLILSDGDFGQAYLTEGWAARFVAGLFRDYTLCFVGYSIDDPVLRYMTAAHALDGSRKIFAFASYKRDELDIMKQKWQDKHVIPIMYDDVNYHRMLHQTLHVWASIYRDGVRGKERLVARYAYKQPNQSSSQNDFVSRMRWALADPSGLPAKCFAQLNPTPSLDWLDVFTSKCFGHNDLTCFGVQPQGKINESLRFSLLQHPASYMSAPAMSVVTNGLSGDWDEVMPPLAYWLTRHLGNPKLLLWVVSNGGQLHRRWRRLVENALSRFDSMMCDGQFIEIDEVKDQSQYAIPDPMMRTLWRLLLLGRIKCSDCDRNIFQWMSRLGREPSNVMLRLELRELLAPKIALRKPYNLSSNKTDQEPINIRERIDWELVLAANNVRYAISHDVNNQQWKTALPYFLDELQQLLRDALDLQRELNDASEYRDFSYLALPSIALYDSHSGHYDWLVLVELLREAWLMVLKSDRVQAINIAQSWFSLPYPLFKRLALFAASQDDCISSELWSEWLRSDNGRWLWARDTEPELFNLFETQGLLLTGNAQAQLETAILAGPPSELESTRIYIEHSIWQLLAKLNDSGLVLGKEAAEHFAILSNLHPEWGAEESNGFASDRGDDDIVPRKRKLLVDWMKQQSSGRMDSYRDGWRDVCRTRFFHTLLALYDLSQEGKWPVDRWRVALQCWSDEKMLLRSWRFVAPLVLTMPEPVLLQIIHAVTWWIERTSTQEHNDKSIIAICRRILVLPMEVDAGSRTIRNGIEVDDPLGSAINHPVGHITQALLNQWFKQQLNDNDGLPADLAPIFTELCDTTVAVFRHGRIVLCSRLITFFRVDQEWTTQILLPLLDWENQADANAYWQGFLWSPRLYLPLLMAFKPHLLACAGHYNQLGEHSQQFATFMTYVALAQADGYKPEEFRAAIEVMPPEGFQSVLHALVQALDGAGEQREEYWINRAKPFWQNIWPKSNAFFTSKIAETLARLVIAARGEFPDALATVHAGLQPIQNTHYVIHLLHQSGLCKQFPTHALSLLNAIIAEPQWVSDELGLCLTAIVQSDPLLEENRDYQRLLGVVRIKTL
ncbi:anti-phage defense-associated sirtuin Dsr1 [Aeromonas veronii]